MTDAALMMAAPVFSINIISLIYYTTILWIENFT